MCSCASACSLSLPFSAMERNVRLINLVSSVDEVGTYVFIIDAADAMYERGLRDPADSSTCEGAREAAA